MKNILSLLLAALLSITGVSGIDPHTAVLSFSANATTGYNWTGFVLGGNSVELADMSGKYIPDPGTMNGRGGKTEFTLNAIQPGQSIILFSYARPWENEPINQKVYLADVDEALTITLRDVTEDGVLTGIVTSVDEENHSVMMNSNHAGEIEVTFNPDDALPVQDETITIYTNGTMTMSLPARMNAIAWAAVPSADARTTPDEAQLTTGFLTGVAYSCSGDENGNLHQAELFRSASGDLLLEITDSPAYDQPLSVSTFAAADDTLLRIADIVNATGMETWGRREDYLFVCDAAHPYLTLRIMDENNEHADVVISGYIEMTESESEAYRSVISLLMESCDSEQMLNHEIIQRD